MANLIKVYPNPWCSVDADGNPNGVVPFDCVRHIDLNEFVGAKRKAEIITAEVSKTFKGKVTGKELVATVTPGRQRTHIEFLGVPAAELKDNGPKKLLKADPVELPLTAYYRKRVLRGELLCADEQTAKVCSVAFVPPQVLLSESASGRSIQDLKSIAAGLAKAAKAPAGEPGPSKAPASSGDK
jgi:hypothetical protein